MQERLREKSYKENKVKYGTVLRKYSVDIHIYLQEKT
jgi:hypothetical protein